MVTIEQSPDPVSLAGNPVCFTARGSNALEGAAPGKAQATLYFDKDLVANDGFYLSVNGERFRFIVIDYTASVDDACSLVLPSGATSMDVVEIAKQLQYHPCLSARFAISSEWDTDQGFIQLEAMSQDAYAVEVESFHLYEKEETNSNISCSQSSQGGMPGLREGYRLHRIVCVTDGNGQETAVADDVLSVDNEGRAKNDIGEYLQPFFSFELQYPVETPVITRPGMFLPYRCRFYEEFQGKSSRIVTSETFHALPGRMSAMDYAVKTSKGEPPCDGAGYKFLSNYKGVKKVYPDYPEKLFFLLPEDFETYSYRLKVVAKFGKRPEEAYIGNALGTGTKNRLVECNVDYVTVMNALARLDMADSYTVYIERTPRFINAGDTVTPVKISEERSYIVEHDKPACLHCYFFINAWGVPETAVLRGRQEMELDISREVNEVKGEEAGQSPLSVRIDKNITVGSGHVTRAEWEWLCEMQRSLQVFELLENRICACTLNNSKSSTVNEFGLWSHEFTYKYAKEGTRAFEGGYSYRYLFDSTFNNTFN